MQHDLCLASRAKRIYANAHTYHINSISVNSDQQTFLSADDLRINLWNLDVTDQSFNIVDIKPPNMDDLTEVRLHPVLGCCWDLGAKLFECGQHRAGQDSSQHDDGSSCRTAGATCAPFVAVETNPKLC